MRIETILPDLFYQDQSLTDYRQTASDLSIDQAECSRFEQIVQAFQPLHPEIWQTLFPEWRTFLAGLTIYLGKEYDLPEAIVIVHDQNGQHHLFLDVAKWPVGKEQACLQALHFTICYFFINLVKADSHSLTTALFGVGFAAWYSDEPVPDEKAYQQAKMKVSEAIKTKSDVDLVTMKNLALPYLARLAKQQQLQACYQRGPSVFLARCLADIQHDVDHQEAPIVLDLSAQWEQENITYGYRANTLADLQGETLYLLKVANETVGFAMLHDTQAKNISSIIPDGTNYCELDEIYIQKAWRHLGLAQYFLETIMEILKQEHCPYLMLTATSKQPEALIHFYQKCQMQIYYTKMFQKLT